MKILQYIELALSIGGSVEMIAALVALGRPVTGSQIESAVQPSILALVAIWPKANPPPAPLVTDICNTAADAINKYVLHLPGAE